MNLPEKVDWVRTHLFDPGTPLCEWTSLADGGSYQQFQNVNFYQNPQGECFEVHGAILGKYIEFHETLGDLGYPTSDEQDNANAEGGKWNAFQNGYITWNPVNWTEVTLTVDTGETEAPVEGGEETPTEVRDWQTVLADGESGEEEKSTAIAAVRALRDAVPAHVKTHPHGFYYYGKVNTKPSTIGSGSVEEWIWDEIHSEGSFDSINAYDNMVVTWGKGLAKTNIAVVLKAMFAQSDALRQAFAEVGMVLGEDGALQVLDTAAGTVAHGDEAYKAMKRDAKLLDFLAEITGNPEFTAVIADEQWAFVLRRNASLIQYAKDNQWPIDGVKLAFHFNWWLPGFAWTGHTAAYKATGGNPTRLILLFKTKQTLFQGELVSHLKTFAGNAFHKYIALDAYKAERPTSEAAVFTDAGQTYYVPF